MLRKLTKLITNNFGLKVLSAVLAVILWMVVVNVEDPDRSAVFTVPVEITNTDYLTEMGKTYEVLDNTDMVSFVVSGPRSVVENLEASDFTVTADMENIDATMSMVPIIVSAASNSSQIDITQRNSFLIVQVENLVTENFRVDVETEGTLAEDCFVDGVSSSVKSVTVSGPESVMDQIAGAQAVLNVNGAAQDVASVQEIVLVDASGNAVSKDRLTLEQTETTVTARVKMRKTVPLEFEVTGTPAAGYRYQEIESDINSIEIEGDAEVLSALEELQITASELDIAGVTSSVTAVIDLTEYLPEDVTLAAGEPKEITVRIIVEAQATVDVEVPVENITVNHLADGLELRFNSQTVIMHITGYSEELSRIDAGELTGRIDVSGLQAGTFNVEVRLDGEYADVSSGSVSVTITGASGGQTDGDAATDTSGVEE